MVYNLSEFVEHFGTGDGKINRYNWRSSPYVLCSNVVPIYGLQYNVLVSNVQCCVTLPVEENPQEGLALVTKCV